MKIITVIFFLLIIITASPLTAQQKYFIYFNDKGTSVKTKLHKKKYLEKIARSTLSERSIERRKKNLGESYFTYDDFPLNKEYLKKIKDLNIKIQNKLKWFNALTAYLNDEQKRKVKQLPFVEKIEKVKTVKYKKENKKHFQTATLDKKNILEHTYNYGPSFTQNQLSQIPAVHDLGITGKNVVIGLLDAGFDWRNRKCLKDANVIAEYDFVNHDTLTNHGYYAHGTAVFSIIAGFDEGELVGPSFDAEYLLAKTEYVPTETHLEEDNYAAALEWMDSIGVDITSSSLGYNTFDKGEDSYTYADMNGKSTIVTLAAEKAFNKGIVVITSAGNEGNTKWHYITAPADGFNVIAVGAVSSDSSVAAFSSRGPTYDGRIKPDVVAQGVSVYHTTVSGEATYSTGNGTSYAAPIVAGIAGQLLSAYPHLTNKQVRNILLECGNNVTSPNDTVGYGILSALKAVTFPNIEKRNNRYVLNKIFPKFNDANAKVIIEYRYIGSDVIKFAQPDSNENGVYEFNIPETTPGSVLVFRYEVKDQAGNTIYQEPDSSFYSWRYSEDNIHLNLNVPPTFETPEKFALEQNYPNPFNATTTIQYSIAQPIPSRGAEPYVSLKVYNILGKEVATLVNKKQPAGNYHVIFDAQNFSSGVYFYRIVVGNFSKTKKMIYLR